MLILSHITCPAVTTAESFFKTFVMIVISRGHHWSAMLQHFKCITKLAFLTSGLFFTSYFYSPNCQRHMLIHVASLKFHPLSLYYLQQAIGSSDNLHIFLPISDFLNFSSRSHSSRLHIKNSKWQPQTQNTCNKGSLIFYSYSKWMCGLPVATPAPLSDKWCHCQTSKQIHESAWMRNITRKIVTHLHLNELSNDLFEW